jgi:hypothetical protein
MGPILDPADGIDWGTTDKLTWAKVLIYYHTR